MPRSRSDAISWGKSQVGHGGWYRMCQKFVRSCYGLGGLYPTAASAFNNAEHKHRTGDYKNVPRGVPFFWDRRDGGAGHVALTLGLDHDGYRLCLSNDVVTPGVINIVRMHRIEREWNYPPAGWTEDLNGSRIWTPKPESGTPNYDKIVEYAKAAAGSNKGAPRTDALKIIEMAKRHSEKY